MRLEFRLLVVDDDAKGSVGSALESLADWLEERGFSLDCCTPDDPSQSGLRDVVQQEGRQFDVVMVDYDLQRPETGVDVVAWLRRQLRYTEMVFYSGLPSRELYKKLVDEEVEGVFVAQRGELDDVLRELADIVVGKAVDLNHTRGIAMAEVAEHEMLMLETLDFAFGQSDTPRIQAISDRTATRLVESKKELAERVEASVKEQGLSEVIHDGRMFTAADKARAIQRMLGVVGEDVGEAKDLFDKYEAEVLARRNVLAHVKEEIGRDGEVILRAKSGRGEEEIAVDQNWMTECRTTLRTHREALERLCQAVRESLGPAAGDEVKGD